MENLNSGKTQGSKTKKPIKFKQIIITFFGCIALSACGEPDTVMQGTFSSLQECLSTIRNSNVPPLDIVTDNVDEVSGFIGNSGRGFACSREVSGTKGVYWTGWFQFDEAKSSPSSNGKINKKIIKALSTYGNTIESGRDGDVTLVAVINTTQKPAFAFKLIFATKSQDLMSKPNAATDPKAYRLNIANTNAWQARFCTKELKLVMSKYSIDIVSADLQNGAGDTQSFSICTD